MRFRKIKIRERRPTPLAERKQRESQRRHSFRVTFTVMLLFFIAACAAYWFWSNQWILTRGRVVASTVAIAATKTGRLQEVLVKQGEFVEAGQPVARLDQRELRAKLEEAQSRLKEMRVQAAVTKEIGVKPAFQSSIYNAESDRLEEEGEQRNIQARMKALQADLAQARIAMERAERLYLLRAMTRPELEAATQIHRRLRAEYQVLQTQLETKAQRVDRVGGVLELARVDLAREERSQAGLVKQLEERVRQAEEQVAQIEAELDLSEIVALRNGVVAWIYKEPGDVVDHNDIVISVVNNKERWIEAYVEAADLGYLREGQRAVVSFHGLTGGTYEGRVIEYVSRYANDKRMPRVGPAQVRTALRLGRVAHPLRIELLEPLPTDIREEMIATVRIRK